MDEETVRRIVREELAKLLSDPPPALADAVFTKIDAALAASIASIAITVPTKRGPAPTPAD
jgi:hypothetical protein